MSLSRHASARRIVSPVEGVSAIDDDVAGVEVWKRGRQPGIGLVPDAPPTTQRPAHVRMLHQVRVEIQIGQRQLEPDVLIGGELTELAR